MDDKSKEGAGGTPLTIIAQNRDELLESNVTAKLIISGDIEAAFLELAGGYQSPGALLASHKINPKTAPTLR